mmetsp:Transcript_67282/g.121197  ORF Transcript_67282/g.121197 Transcript_67282/m.121197 type:complete len:149 (+) Transcript_67282:73-519(+)
MPTISELKRRQPKPSEPKWWERPAARAGEKSNAAQQRLSDSATFTGFYKQRAVAGCTAMMRTASGDYCELPIQAAQILASSTYGELTRPHGAADFCSEVTWRLQLRPLSPVLPSIPDVPWRRSRSQPNLASAPRRRSAQVHVSLPPAR